MVLEGIEKFSYDLFQLVCNSYCPPLLAVLYLTVSILNRADARITTIDVFCSNYVPQVYMSAKVTVSLAVFGKMQIVDTVAQDAICSS